MKRKKNPTTRSSKPRKLRPAEKGRPGARRFSRPKPESMRVAPSATTDFEEMALNKFVALSGVCSRRKAAELVGKGLVAVNGEVETKPFRRVTPKDEVVYDGTRLTVQATKRYILLNKPKNCITSLSDPDGRRTVIDVVEGACTERIFPVGRLDRNTTGLLLLTNDGELAKKLSHPSHGVKKLYYATLDKPMPEAEIERILAGLELEDGPAPVDACGFVEGSKQMQIGIEIHIGRNRIVRRIFEHLGYEVVKLDRVLYASLTKKNIGRGRWRHLKEEEVIRLKHLS